MDGGENSRADVTNSSSRIGSTGRDTSISTDNGGHSRASNAEPALFLYGESFGAAAVLHMVLRYPDLATQLSGVITSGVPIKRPEVLPPAPVLAVVQLIGRLYPLLPMPKGDAFKPETYVKAFGDEELARRALMEDPLIVRQSQVRCCMGGVEGWFVMQEGCICPLAAVVRHSSSWPGKHLRGTLASRDYL